MSLTRLHEISHEEETAHAPLGGASPQTVQSVSEKEEDLPAAMDCTSLALVDAVQSNPASLRDAARTLLAENQDWCNRFNYFRRPTYFCSPFDFNLR